MDPVIIIVHPVRAGGVSMEVQHLVEYLIEGGEPARQGLLVALETLSRHIRHGSNLMPQVETIQ